MYISTTSHKYTNSGMMTKIYINNRYTTIYTHYRYWSYGSYFPQRWNILVCVKSQILWTASLMERLICLLLSLWLDDAIHNMNAIDQVEIAQAIVCKCAELTFCKVFNKNDLTIVSQNIRSIYHNFDDFLVTLSDLPFNADILIFSECRLNIGKPVP